MADFSLKFVRMKSMAKQKLIYQFQVLSEILVNLSSGFVGLIILSPFSNLNFIFLIKNIVLACILYYFAVKLRK